MQVKIDMNQKSYFFPKGNDSLNIYYRFKKLNLN